MKKLIAIAATLAVSAAFAGAEQLVIKGSDTLGAKLVPQLAEAYKAENPGSSFNIAAEGSSTGFAALIDQTANIGMSSRRAKPTEISAALAKGLELRPTIVAWDGIAIVLNAGNPIKSLTKKQVEQIFAGDITDWSAVGGKPGKISIYTRNTASGTYADFKELAMNKRDYAGSAQKMAGNEQIVSEVGKNLSGIGYVGLAYTKAEGIKVAEVDGKTPTQADVRDKSYPYSRPTFYYTNGAPAGATKAFVDFTLSAKGQKIVEQVGFVPVK
ncbi:MAG: phosphate ABC transporter substrate-binding protein [Verrucomicrobiota bacterium]